MQTRFAVLSTIIFGIACGNQPHPDDVQRPDAVIASPDTALPDTALPDTALPDTALPDTRCFIAYVHGWINSANLDPAVATDAQRRAYWQPTPGSTTFDLVDASSRHGECLTLVTGYDTSRAFFEDGAAGTVARQIARFVRDNNVPDHRLILIGHSMGGLVIRSILNSYLINADYTIVSQKTNYAITIATPHTGSPAADALYGVGKTTCSNIVAGLAEFVGAVTTSNATLSFTRQFMEQASAAGGSMGDINRTRRIYTIATMGYNLGIANDHEDSLLYEAWNCLGYGDSSGATVLPGDGVVTLFSGRAIYERTGSSGQYSWTNGTMIEGLWRQWLTTNLNHHHAAFSDVQVDIADLVNGTFSQGGSLGDYIAVHGLNLE